MLPAYGAATQGSVGPYRTAGGGPVAYSYGESQEQQPLAYNLPAKPFSRPQRKSVNIVMVLATLFIPWITFVATMSLEGFSLHYSDNASCKTLSIVILCGVLCFGLLAVNAWRKQQSEGLQDPTWLIILFVTSLIAWFVGMASGNGIFTSCMKPFYEVNALNVYQSVDPSLYGGQQLMDAGTIVFTPNAELDFKHAMGFKNLDTYCVSPIVSPTSQVATNASEARSYDFWAVGLNCCSGHAADFQCGEYNNPSAKSGLRLMRDDQRAYFRLAVQQAEAAYNIRAGHPIFLYWMQNPQTEINAYQDDGYKYFLLGVFSFFAYQLFIVVASTIIVSKAGA